MANNEREQREQQGGRTLARRRQGEGVRRGMDPFGFSAGDFLGNPFAAMRRMHDEMDRMMAEAIGQRSGGGTMQSFGWSPAVEVAEKENELQICAELPGLKPEDVRVEVTEDALVIEGERKHETENKEESRWHSERSYGRFYRAIPLPEGANTDQARAEFKNGELRISVPVQRQTKRRQITIGSGTVPEQTTTGQQPSAKQNK